MDSSSNPSSSLIECKDCQLPTSGKRGYPCPRLGCRMNPHWCKLYTTNPKFTDAWDRGTGPGQHEQKLAQAVSPQDMPPLHEQVSNFLKSMQVFVADGMRIVDQKTYDARLETCKACRFFSRERGRCRKCGCAAKYKARGRVWTCPMGYWPPIPQSSCSAKPSSG